MRATTVTTTCLGISGDGEVVVYGTDSKLFIGGTEISVDTTVKSTAVNNDGSRVLTGGVIPQEVIITDSSPTTSLQATDEQVYIQWPCGVNGQITQHTLQNSMYIRVPCRFLLKILHLRNLLI